MQQLQSHIVSVAVLTSEQLGLLTMPGRDCLLVSSREALWGLGEGGGEGRVVVTWGSAKAEDLESLSQVI